VTVVLAHVGHWLVSVAYALPVLVLLGWLAVVRAREWMRGRAGDGGAPAPRPDGRGEPPPAVRDDG
jgi:hypothetical protein